MSGAPFVEVTAEGVTKATGRARLRAHLGVAQADVVAFGDAVRAGVAAVLSGLNGLIIWID